MTAAVKHLLLCSLLLSASGAGAGPEYDLVIYGATPAGVAAAVQAKRMGLRAVLIEPTTRIGGLTTGGLGRTDVGTKETYGGIAREFYAAVADWYRDPAHWTRETRDGYAAKMKAANDRRFLPDADTMWCFEPSAALKILEGWERRDGLDIRRGEYLDRESKSGVEVEGGRIKSIRTLSGNEYRGRMFIDATYEGDLMAAAGVTYVVGREGNAKYGETVNGVQKSQGHHRLLPGVDPYVVKGDPSSGLLPGVEPDDGLADGSGDKRVQAYCYRMCLTDDPENRIPFRKPADFNELDYELFFRNCEQGDVHVHRNQGQMPNRKTDTNNDGGFSTDFIGQSADYPEAGYAERERIARRHLSYQQGLMWVLANHPRTPKELRDEYSRWGTCRDEFAGEQGDGWQRQLYVREARRMVGDYVMTEHNRRNTRIAPRPVAVGSYQMDSHHCRRYVGADGFVHNEGDVQVGSRYPRYVDGREQPYQGFDPYGIDYGAIVPKRGECANLLVPVCVSASHIAYGSIRMEPVFFALGQAAATGAGLALKRDCAVQDVPYADLRARLLADGQALPKEKAKAAAEDFDAEIRGLGKVSVSFRPTADGSETAFACANETVARQLASKRRADLLAFGDLRAEADGVIALKDVGFWTVGVEGARVCERFSTTRPATGAAAFPAAPWPSEGGPAAEDVLRPFTGENDGTVEVLDGNGKRRPPGELPFRACRRDSPNGVYDVFVSTRCEAAGPGVPAARAARIGFFLPGRSWIGLPAHDFAPMETVAWKLPRPDVARAGVSWIRALGRAAAATEVMDMVHHNPGEPFTVTAYTDPAKLAACGMDAMVVNEFVFPQCAVTFDAFDARVFPEGSEERAWALGQRARMRAKCRACHAAGLRCYYFMDVIVLPKRLVELHRDELCDAAGRITFDKPLTERVHRLMLDELFTVVPELDGVVVRTGETYLNNTPYHVGNGPVDCRNALEKSKDVHVRLMNLLREEVCVRKNRRVYYRTWDFGYFHTRPDYYLAVTERVEPHTNLVLSVKHTKGDYLRTFAFNPTLGLGRHRQIVEVQCAREYEGKGAFPNYVGDSVVNGYEENADDPGLKSLSGFARHPLFAGVWTWSRGGGSHGPFLANEFWCDMNARVLAAWAKNPAAGEEGAFDAFAGEIGVPASGRADFRRLCALAQRAIIRGRGTMLRKGATLAPYMKEPDNWYFVGWSRDDCLGGEREMRRTMDGLLADGLLEARLAEMGEACGLWRDVVALADAFACRDAATAAYVRTSSRYGEILHRIMWHGCEVVYRGYAAARGKMPRDEALIARHAAAYDAAWADFYTLKATAPDCASLYCDEYPRYVPKCEEVPDGVTHKGGLGESVRRYRRPCPAAEGVLE